MSDLLLGPVTLRVGDLARALTFYEDVLGFRRVAQTATTAALGAEDGVPVLALRALPGARPRSPQTTGLYHAAILLPSRSALGHTLRRLLETGISFGQSDHLVSEALYLSDPDGNGLEIYRDRPREAWPWDGETVRMAVDPLDLQGLLAEAASAPDHSMLPAGTRLGHMHLQVASLPEAEQFYRDRIGLSVTARMPGAVFMSADGYHHHIGLNTWHSRGAGPTPEGAVGLDSFTITRHSDGVSSPDPAVLTDPAGNTILLRTGAR